MTTNAVAHLITLAIVLSIGVMVVSSVNDAMADADIEYEGEATPADEPGMEFTEEDERIMHKTLETMYAAAGAIVFGRGMNRLVRRVAEPYLEMVP